MGGGARHHCLCTGARLVGRSDRRTNYICARRLYAPSPSTQQQPDLATWSHAGHPHTIVSVPHSMLRSTGNHLQRPGKRISVPLMRYRL